MSQLSGPQNPQSGTRLVVIAVAVAVVAVILMNVYVSMARREAREGEFIVYRLNRAVQAGDRLNERDVEAVAVPQRFRSAFANAVDADGLTTRVGSAFERAANSSDVLTYDLFVAPEGDELDRLVGRDMRLVALQVNSSSLPGTLRPGMFVDIEAPFASQGALPNVLPVMERVKVLAVGRRSVVDQSSGSGSSRGGSMGSYSTISIEVTPQQATELSMVQKIAAGDFELHLRNPGDMGTPKIPTGGINPEVLRLVEQPALSTRNR
jgi:Flp pilus assembly protein CpaB